MPQSSVTENGPAEGALSVLIVEDEFLIALEIEAVLHDMGLRTLGPAAAGREAVAIALRHHPDLLLMDVRLRDDMDGITAAAAILAQGPVPVVFLSGHADDRTRRRIAALGGATLLTKPTRPDRLRDAVAQALGID